MSKIILGIESSCDDTAVAIVKDEFLLSNIISGQEIHKAYGGVVPELASRAHQQNIVPVMDQALKRAGIHIRELDAIAFTRGPGLMGSLLVGTSFAKGLSLALSIPLIEVHHLHAHIMVHFIRTENLHYSPPDFPFLCLLVSGGHTQLIKVKDYFDMEIIGQTIDDAAGEAFDKCAKLMGLPYPGGPLVDKYALNGNPEKFRFNKPSIADLNYSFSGLKTSFLYFLKEKVAEDKTFIENNKEDLCASIQKTIIEILLQKLIKASKETGINRIVLAGGVSANQGLRKSILREADIRKWTTFLPNLSYTTDNAAMIAITGYYKYKTGQFARMDVTPLARMNYNKSV